jgi:DNA-binding CsgD family transcriptional regulator
MNVLHEALLLLRRSRGERTTSLHVRLFAFFALFATALVGAGCLVLSLFGVWNVAEKEGRSWLETEMGRLSNSVSQDMSRLSLRGIALAEQITSDIGIWSRENGVSESALQSSPDMLADLLSKQMSSLLAALKNNRVSGVFVILDATVNPDAEDAAHSRAGIFLKLTESYNVSALSGKVHCLRGPASVARENGVELMMQWQMEFDVSNAPYYSRMLSAARENGDLPLSRLYCWTERVLLKRNSEAGTLLCVPLIARDGTVYGICGMEVSAMLFKRLYSPDNSDFFRVFSALSPSDSDGFDTERGFVAGNYYLNSRDAGNLTETRGRDGLRVFDSGSGESYIGLSEPFRLYPSGSPFENETWSLAILMPVEEWDAAMSGDGTGIAFAASLLLALSLIAAVFVSRRYIRPVVDALELIKTDERAKPPKTRIAEIDDLFEYLAALDERKAAEREAPSQDPQGASEESAGKRDAAAGRLADYERFVRNIEMLTATERIVFNLYAEGLKAQEIASKLVVSINTIKFHNKNIYMKLGVKSAKEMLVYVKMMGGESVDM